MSEQERADERKGITAVIILIAWGVALWVIPVLLLLER